MSKTTFSEVSIRICSLILISLIAACITAFVFHRIDRTGIAKSSGQERMGSLENEIINEHHVGQSIVCPHDDLCGISIRFATYARQNNSTYFLDFYERDRQNIFQNFQENHLFQQKFNALDISDNQFNLFTFPCLESCRGKTFRFMLSSSNARSGNSLSIWYTNRDRYVEGSRFNRDTPVEGDLSFRIYRHLPLRELLHRIADGLPFPWSWPYLPSLCLFFVFFLTVTLIAIVIATATVKER